MSTWQHFMTKVMDSQKKFGLDKNGNSNYGEEVVKILSLQKRNPKIICVACFYLISLDSQ